MSIGAMVFFIIAMTISVTCAVQEMIDLKAKNDK
mgnify:CR=1 FL=1